MIECLHDGPTKFALAGLDLNVPVDLVPPNKYSKVTNGVSKIEGRLETRDGISLVASVAPAVPIHTIFRLTQSSASVLSERLVGAGTTLYTAPLPSGSAFVPLAGPVLSGGPLSIIQFRFDADPAVWAIIADANGMMKRRAGYYQALGLEPPSIMATANIGGAGLLNSSTGTSYDWRYTYLNEVTLSESNGSPTMQTSNDIRLPSSHQSPDPALGGLSFTAITDTNGSATIGNSSAASARWGPFAAALGPYASLTLSFRATASFTGPSSSANKCRIEYSTDGGTTWVLASTGNGPPLGTIYVSLPAGTDLTKLLVRASLFTGAAGNTGTLTVSLIQSNGALTSSVAVALALVNQSANVCVTAPTDPQETAIRLYRRGGTLPNNWFNVGQFAVSSLTQGACGAGALQINDNVPDSQAQLGAILPQDNFQPIQSVQAVNFPLPVIFGPSDGRVLACGDPARPDAVYFSNRGNADLWGAEAWVTVANPGEQIMNGLVYNLRTFAFSRERLYIMLPNIIQGITFTPAETACRRGLKGRWGLASGERGIYFWTKDGICRTSGGPEESIIDDSIRPLFPTREAPTGTPTNGYDSINMADEDGLRMAFHNGEIWCFYTGATTGLRQLMIFDEHRSRWRPGTYTPAMQMAYSEPNTSSSLLYGGTNGSLYAAGGSDDAGTPIQVEVVTGAFDQQRPLNLKEYLNTVFDIDPGGATVASPVTIIPRVNGDTSTGLVMRVTGTGRQRIPLPLNNPWHISEPGAFVSNPVLDSVYGKVLPQPGGFQGEIAAAYQGFIAGPNQFAECTIASVGPLDVTTNNHSIGPAVRMSFSASGLISCYALEWRYDRVLQMVWEVNCPPGQQFSAATDGVVRDVLAINNNFGVVDGDVLRIEAVGNQITGKVNGAVVLGPVTDVRITAGQPGLEGYPENSTLAFATQVSNFHCGTLPSGVIQSPGLPGPVNGEIYAYNLEYDISWAATPSIRPILYQYETLYRHEPAEVTHWELPRTSVGMQGWFHIRDMYIVLRSSADVTLTVTPDSGASQSFVLPSTSGLKDTLYVKLAASKSNSYAFALDSAAPFRVYADEIEVRAKQWLTKLGYQNMPLIGKEQIGSMNV